MTQGQMVGKACTYLYGCLVLGMISLFVTSVLCLSKSFTFSGTPEERGASLFPSGIKWVLDWQ